MNHTLCLYLRPNSWPIYQNTFVPCATSHPSISLPFHAWGLWVPLDSQSFTLFPHRPAGVCLTLTWRGTCWLKVPHKYSDLTRFEERLQFLSSKEITWWMYHITLEQQPQWKCVRKCLISVEDNILTSAHTSSCLYAFMYIKINE